MLDGICGAITAVLLIGASGCAAGADEIIAAFDEWNKDRKPPRGYKKATREADRAEREYGRLEDEIAETRATTFDGILAKVRCAQAFEKSEEISTIDGGSATEVMALSIFDDLIQLGTSSIVSIADGPITPDPIFAAIETHREAAKAHTECGRHHDSLEETLPEEQRESWCDKIVETDDPRWVDSLRAAGLVRGL